MWAHPTVESDGGVLGWPTPEAYNDPKSGGSAPWQPSYKEGSQIHLHHAVQMGNWPTPRAGNPGSRKPGTGGKVLNEEAKNWPTPTANEDAAGLPTGNMQAMLGNHPNLRNVTGESQRGPQAQANQTSGQESLQNDQTSPPPSPKTLSPIFVEWMMGVPVGWTSLKPLGTESYQQWLQSFSGG